MARYAPSMRHDPEHDHARPPRAARRRPAARSRSRAGRPSRPGRRSPPARASPSGTAWRRTRSGWSTTSTSGSSRLLVERRPRALRAAATSPTASSTSPVAEVLAAALDGDARRGRRCSVTMPGNDALADERRARRDHDLGEPALAVERRASSASSRQPVLVDQGPRVPAEVARRSCAAVRVGQQPLPEQRRRWRSSRRRAGRRRARTRRTRTARRRTRSPPRTTMTFTACRSAPASSPRAPRSTSGHQQLATASGPSRTAITTTTGRSAATAPLTLIERGQGRHQQHHQHEQPRAAVARPGR